jgi:hypothetical protein
MKKIITNKRKVLVTSKLKAKGLQETHCTYEELIDCNSDTNDGDIDSDYNRQMHEYLKLNPSRSPGFQHLSAQS